MLIRLFSPQTLILFLASSLILILGLTMPSIVLILSLVPGLSHYKGYTRCAADLVRGTRLDVQFMRTERSIHIAAVLDRNKLFATLHCWIDKFFTTL